MDSSYKGREGPRLLPGAPLPAYAHVPGQTPHPFSDPAGHSCGEPPPVPPPIDPARWEESRAYLRGLDLFNHGYYWEAHEAWEGLWRIAGGATADFLKGLIQLAVAGVKHRQGLPDRVRAHARRAAELWRGVGEGHYLGLSVPSLVALADRIEREGWPEAVALVPERGHEPGP